MSRPSRARAASHAPLPLWALAVVGVCFLALPLVALLQRAPWRGLGDHLREPVVTEALRLSLVTATGATVLCLLVGVPLAWVLARSSLPGLPLLRALVTLPMVLPPVVGGAALLYALGRRGLVGGPLHDATGLLLPYSAWGVVVANAFVALPFVVLSVEAGLRTVGTDHEEAAATLGADGWLVLRRVTLPAVVPSVATGAVLAWARALGEFGASVTFAGNLEGRTRTMPLAIYLELQSGRETAIVLSLVLVAVSLLVLVPLRDRWLPG